MRDETTNNHGAFIWSVADLLRGVYKQSEHKGKTETFWHRTPVSTISITERKERDRIISRRWNGDPP